MTAAAAKQPFTAAKRRIVPDPQQPLLPPRADIREQFDVRPAAKSSHSYAWWRSQTRCQSVANFYTANFTAMLCAAKRAFIACFGGTFSSLARDMRVAGRYVFEVVPSKRSSRLCSRLTCTIMAPMGIRYLASLPVLNSRSLNSCDINSRTDCSRHPRRLRPWGRHRAIPQGERPAPALVTGTNMSSYERTRSTPAIRR